MVLIPLRFEFQTETTKNKQKKNWSVRRCPFVQFLSSLNEFPLVVNISIHFSLELTYIPQRPTRFNARESRHVHKDVARQIRQLAALARVSLPLARRQKNASMQEIVQEGAVPINHILSPGEKRRAMSRCDVMHSDRSVDVFTSGVIKSTVEDEPLENR